MRRQRGFLRQMVPESRFRRMGLHKLTPSELDELEKFIEELLRRSQPQLTPPPAVFGAPPNIDLDFAYLDGRAIIVAQDPERTYLGKISSNRYDPDSIINEYGRGSKFRQDSIMNEHGKFGGTYSQYSPFNPYALNPPKVFVGSRFVGYLTKNTAKHPRIDPDALIGYLRSRAR